MKKKIIYVAIALLVIIQFLGNNNNNGTIWDAEKDVTFSVNTSQEVQDILQTSCADCHSNKTNYPWYSYVQPLGFWLQYHVKEGKQELNFSVFNNYNLKRKVKKLKEVAEMIEENEMPIKSYTLIHTKAKLSESQKLLLIEWANQGLIDTSAVE